MPCSVSSRVLASDPLATVDGEASDERETVMLQQLRANALAASALAVALTGTSIAIAGLPHNSVGSKQIKKAGVHKTDIHKHAVTTSKLATGVLRQDGFAEEGFSGETPSNTPEQTLELTQIKTTTPGRIFGFARGVHNATCTAGNAVASLYVDGAPLVASGARVPSANTALNVWGITANSVAPGTHMLRFGIDCPSGSLTGFGTVAGSAGIGAIVLRD